MKHRLLPGLLFLLFSTIWASLGQAATITTSVQNGTTFCRTSTVRVNYTVSGFIDPSNVFTAELSDETGSFAAPVAIGSLSGTAGSTINATLPANVVTGSGYRVRVVASNPTTIGSDNGQDLIITNIGTVTAGSNSPVCATGNLLLTASTVPGASYSWTGPGGFTSLLQNPSIANVGVNRSGTYTVTASANGCTTTSSVAVTVNALPTASVNPVNPTICSGQSVTLNASGGTNYLWSPATGLSSTTVASPVASPTASTIYTVTVSNAAGCQSTAQTTVTVRATPVLTVTGNVTICAGTSTTLSASGAQTYSWSPSTGLSNPNSATPIASPTATTTYTVTGSSNGCTDTGTVTVTVEPRPTPTAGPDRVLCSGQSAQLGAAPVAGLVYSWSPSTGLSSTTSSQPIVTRTNTGAAPINTTYTLTAVSPTGCVGSSTVRVTVNPAVTVNAGPARSFCSGGSAQLGGSAPVGGYIYSWSPTTGLNNASVAQPTVTLTNTGAAPVTTTYTLTASNNGCSNTSSVAVTVNPLTTADFAYNAASYCQSSANPVPTIAGTTGGTFSSTAGLSLNASTGAIDLSSSTAGTYTVTYSVGGPCPSSSSQQVTVATPGAAGFSYAAPAYCASGANPTATLSPGAAPGTFTATPAGLSLNASTGAINLAASQPGTYTVTNTVAANGACQAATATTQVSVSAVPAAALAVSGSTTICQGSAVYLTANGGGTNATYQFLLNGQPISGATSATYAATQSGTYSVVITNPGNCTATSAGTTVTVNPVTTPTLAYGAASYCQNAGTNPGPTVSVQGGTFSAPAGLSLNASTGVINLAASQPGTYAVRYSAGSPCPGTATASVTITAAPSAAFAYASSTLCASGGSAVPTITGTTGGTFSSTAGLSLNASTGAIDLGSSTAGTYTVTYSVGTACTAVATASVTITMAPVATFSYAGSSYCAAAQGNVSPVFGSGASAGTFSSTSGLSLNPATGVINLAASQAGAYTVTNTIPASGSCAAATATATITLAAPPVATLTAGGVTAICQGTSVQLTAGGGGSGATYQFLLNGQPIAGATTFTYSASAAGSYAVIVTSGSGCSSTSPATSITVNPATSAAFSYPATAFCNSSPTSTPSITGTPGGTFAAGTGLSLNAATGAIDPSASTPGTYTVTYSVGGSCPSSSTATITISAPASAAFSYASAMLCATGTAAPALGTGATTGTFTSTPGLSIDASTGAINLGASAAGTYTVTNTVSSTGACGGATASTTVTINALPARPTVSAAYNGPTTTLTSSAGTGNQWYFNGVAIAGATNATYVVNTAAQLGPYTVTTTNATTGCVSLPSAPLVVTATAGRAATAAFQLYPNPTRDGKLMMELTGVLQPVQLTVLNALGQVVYHAMLPAASAAHHSIDLRTLPVGVYLLRASSADGTATRRFVRE
ncbi:T9SS type A sorting domain-containing protein [Hymenobacter sp. BT175]|uniref:T9SS type A sorting domain-containing protein n=1 Tax=Hymenobacter translucens TaxID=2886507 RepID=UPI001D0ED27D|nr:T9SS type A sorting domain-containing protein [Hymenobacter translucens]MCC2548237.1 T9SS type A sorting domain-containing protein [Hymenobacter translucens]